MNCFSPTMKHYFHQFREKKKKKKTNNKSGYLADIVSQKNEVSLRTKESNWQYWLPSIEIKN